MRRAASVGVVLGVVLPALVVAVGLGALVAVPRAVGLGGLGWTVGCLGLMWFAATVAALAVASLASAPGGDARVALSVSLGAPLSRALTTSLHVILAVAASVPAALLVETLAPEIGLDLSGPWAGRLYGLAALGAIAVLALTPRVVGATVLLLGLAAAVAGVVTAVIGRAPWLAADAALAPMPPPPSGWDAVIDLPIAATSAALVPISATALLVAPLAVALFAGLFGAGARGRSWRELRRGIRLAAAIGLLALVGLATWAALVIDRVDLGGAIASRSPLGTGALGDGVVVTLGVAAVAAAAVLALVTAAARAATHLTAAPGPRARPPADGLLLAVGVAAVGVLVGDPALVAALVAVALAILTGAVVVAYLIARASNPRFRPEYRLGLTLAVLGVVASAASIALLDPLLLAAACAVVAGLFVALRGDRSADEVGPRATASWRELVAGASAAPGPSADGLASWRPNLLLFTARGAPSREALVPAALGWVRGRGVVTDLELYPTGAPTSAAPAPSPTAEASGLLRRPTPTADPLATVEALTRHYGFVGLEPNVVAIDWSLIRGAPERFDRLVAAAAERGVGLVVAACGDHDAALRRQRVDLWADPSGRGLALGMPLGQAAAAPGGAELRVAVTAEDLSRAERLLHAARALVDRDHVACRFVESVGRCDLEALRGRVAAESADADLVIVPLPTDRDGGALVAHVEGILAGLRGDLLLVAAAPAEEAALQRRLDPRPAPPGAGDDVSASAPLVTPRAPELDREARRFAAHVEPALTEFGAASLEPVVAEHHAFVRRVRGIIKRQVGALGVARSPARRLEALARAQARVIAASRVALDEFASTGVPLGASSLRRAVDALVTDAVRYDEASPAYLWVSRPAAEVAKSADDPWHLRWLKWRLRAGAYLGRRSARQRVRASRLHAYHLRYRVFDEAAWALERLASASHDLARRLGRAITDLVAHLAELEDRARAGEQGLHDEIAVAGAHALAELAELDVGLHAWLADQRAALARSGRTIAQGFADDLGRLDVARVAQREREAPDLRRRFAELSAAPEVWERHHGLVLQQGGLGISLAGLERRLATATERVRRQAVEVAQAQVVRPIVALHGALTALLEAAVAGEATLTEGISAAQRAAEAAPSFEGEALVTALEQETTAAVDELPETLAILPAAGLDALEEAPLAAPEAVVTPLQRVVAELVEVELVGPFQEELASVPEDARRALEVAQDVERLVSFAVADLVRAGGVPDAAARAQLVPVIEAGVARLAEALEGLRRRVDGIDERMVARLRQLHALMQPAALVSRAASVGQPRASQGGGLGPLVRHAIRRGRRAVQRALVSLVYRASGGLVSASRSVRTTRPEDAFVERALALVTARTPAPAVLEGLPFYYRQLFLSRLAHESGFWVGREVELAAAERAVGHHRSGVGGALFVVGGPGAGKSAFASVVARRHFDFERVYRVRPPSGGGPSVGAFEAALGEALDPGGRGEVPVDELLRDAVVIVEDAELWWERAGGGLVVIDHLLGLIDHFGERVFFVVEMGLHAFRAIARFRDLGRRALAVVECAPLGAKALRALIETRHRAAGLHYQIEGRGEAVLGDLRRARLFAALSADSTGLVGPALQAWVNAIDRVGEGVLEMRPPPLLDESVLDALELDLIALIVQIILHRELTETRLARVARLDRSTLAAQLATLRRAGLLTRRADGALALDRYVGHRVVHHLEQRGLLP